MPKKPKKPCRYPGCPELTTESYCTKHSRENAIRRGNSSERGYDSRWRKARSRFLKAHPLCVKCLEQSKLAGATVVDHIIPHRGNQIQFWDEKNWQPLCKPCHDRKTMTEDRYQEYKF